MMIERTMPPLNTDERTTLEAWLDFYRNTLALKCDGLDDPQLRTTASPPSRLTLLGLVQHMAEVSATGFVARVQSLSSMNQEEHVAQLLRVQNFNVSRDGFGAGQNQSLERPFGDADPADMFAWAGATASWPNRTEPGGSRGLDDYFTRDFAHNIGAEIMGRNKFGPQRGPWHDHEWRGWWGDEPPFHTPVFVMTHYDRPSFSLSDTTFHFVNADPATALELAREAAQGKDVRLGGGATTIRQFLDADLVDTLHVAVSQVELGAGSRLWESPDELHDRFYHEVVPSPSGVTHHLFWRR